MSMTFCVSRDGAYLIASDCRYSAIDRRRQGSERVTAVDAGGKLVRIGETWLALSGRPHYLVPVMEQVAAAGESTAALWRALEAAAAGTARKQRAVFTVLTADRTGVGRVANLGVDRPLDNAAYCSPPPGSSTSARGIMQDVKDLYDAQLADALTDPPAGLGNTAAALERLRRAARPLGDARGSRTSDDRAGANGLLSPPIAR